MAAALIGNGRHAIADVIKEGSGETLRYGYGITAGGLDANTTHLWRFDEPTGTLADSTTVTATAIPLQYAANTAEQASILFATGGATNSSRRIDTNTSSSANGNIMRAFAQATEPSTDDNLTPDQYNSFFGADGSFTLDFLIRPDFNPGSTPNVSAGMRIFSQEGNDSDTEPNFFSLTWHGTNQLELVTSPSNLFFDIPLVGANAFTASGQWFHVGISYNGDAGAADNTSFYWTLVDGPDTALALATSAANLAGTYTFADDPMTVTSGPGPEWNFGNRPAGNRSLVGALDEFRISNVARGPGDFIFTASSMPDGDYNADGKVDAADYVLWRKDPGSYGGDPGGYNAWRAAFGTGTGSGALLGSTGGVPEPNAVLLMFVGTLLLNCRRPKRNWKACDD